MDKDETRSIKIQRGYINCTLFVLTITSKNSTYEKLYISYFFDTLQLQHCD